MLQNGSSNADMITATTDSNGKFCLQAAPGNYRIEVGYFVEFMNVSQ